MPRGVHKNPFLGWNPPAEDSAWLEAEVQRRGGDRGVRTALLNEALADLRAKHSAKHRPEPVSPPRARSRKPHEAPAPAAVFVAAGQPEPTDSDCPHPKARIHKGLCGACGTNVGTRSGGPR